MASSIPDLLHHVKTRTLKYFGR